VGAGDTIEIVTDTPIDESLTIHKSLTLTAGSGFRPVIGASATVRDVTVDDTGGSPVAVTIADLDIRNGKVDVSFFQQIGDTFTISGSSVRHRIDSNNESGVSIDVAVSGSTSRVIGNFLRTTGQPVDLSTGMTGAADTAKIEVIGNTITTSQASNAYHGITTDLRGAGHVTVNEYSNVIHDMMGCFCGGAGGIEAGTQNTVVAAVDIVGNTIDHTEKGSPGIVIDAPRDASSMTANLFDNIVTNTVHAGAIWLPDVTNTLRVRNGFNDFFGNDRRSRFGGYVRGPSTLSVGPRYIDAASSDYRLRKDSPLRDRGAPCTAGGLARRDAADHARLVGASVDIGAFEIGAGRVSGGSNVFGTGGADVLTGTPGADVLCGFGGADTISGEGGNDHVYGGPGGDLAQGQGGPDYVEGDVGADTIRGGAGDDRLAGRDGKPGDTLSGGPGRDACKADPGDRVRGCP
jgi:hypothetical protein